MSWAEEFFGLIYTVEHWATAFLKSLKIACQNAIKLESTDKVSLF